MNPPGSSTVVPFGLGYGCGVRILKGTLQEKYYAESSTQTLRKSENLKP